MTVGMGLAALYRSMASNGLAAGSSGNASLRVGGGRMLITATGARVDSATAADSVEVDFDGVAAGRVLPSSEWAMHAAIYRASPAAGAIVHAHSDAATALACLGEGLPPFHYMVAEFGGHDVRCAPYATFGTAALAELAAAAIAGRSACLLANHGMICHGRSPEAALATALRLELLARQYLLARSAGSPHLLSADQMEAALLRYKSYGQQPGGPA